LYGNRVTADLADKPPVLYKRRGAYFTSGVKTGPDNILSFMGRIYRLRKVFVKLDRRRIAS
jgi:hypothetical protein